MLEQRSISTKHGINLYYPTKQKIGYHILPSFYSFFRVSLCYGPGCRAFLYWTFMPMKHRLCKFRNKPLLKVVSKLCYSLDRRMHLIGLKWEFLREEVYGRLLKEFDDFISQPSTFLGTQTSKRTWPRTPWRLMLGGWGKWIKPSFCSSCKDPKSLPS